MKYLFLLLFFPFLSCAQKSTSENEITIVAWNVESGGANPDSIAYQIINHLNAPDILALSEVSPREASVFLNAFAEIHGAYAEMVLSDKGGNDRLAILYSTKNLKLINAEELESISLYNSGLRPSQAFSFEHKNTRTEFIVLNNHLSRGTKSTEYKRISQSYMLQNWANNHQNTPLFMVGDFNFDYALESSNNSRSDAYDVLTLNKKGENKLYWVKPKQLIRTQCSWDEKRQKCRYNSILDFAFCNESGFELSPSSEILSEKFTFPDGESRSDHRPVVLTLRF